MVSHRIDATDTYNLNGFYNVAIGLWDYVVVEIINPTAQVNFNTTTDAGDIQGITDGNAQLAKNWQACMLTNLSNDARVTSTSLTGIFKLNVGGRFFQLQGAGTCGKIVINFSTIS
jgi:hypothetical protein